MEINCSWMLVDRTIAFEVGDLEDHARGHRLPTTHPELSSKQAMTVKKRL